MEAKIKIVPFNPTVKRKVRANKLVSLIMKRAQNKALTAQDRFKDFSLNKMMLRLYHIAHGTSSIYSFPFHTNETTDKDGIASLGKWSKHSIVNVKNAYEAICAQLINEGFDAVVTHEPCEHLNEKKRNPTYFTTTLTINNIAEEYRSKVRRNILKDNL